MEKQSNWERTKTPLTARVSRRQRPGANPSRERSETGSVSCPVEIPLNIKEPLELGARIHERCALKDAHVADSVT